MKIGILQAGHSPEGLVAEFGDYGDLYVRFLRGYGFVFQIYAVVDGEFPASINEVDGWVVTGSRYGAYEPLDWIPKLESFLREAFAAKKPIVGICFGHQVLAQALGGVVEKYSGGWSVGPTEYSSGDTTLVLNAWHQDQVVKLPPGAQVLASSDICENAILAYGDQALSIQAHPEFGAEFLHALVEKRGRGNVPDALLDAAESRLDIALSNQPIGDRIAEFFRTSQKQAGAA